MIAVLLGAGLASCDKEDEDLRPSPVSTEPFQTKPTEVGQEEQGMGDQESEMPQGVQDNRT
jgi:hypothetical protein